MLLRSIALGRKWLGEILDGATPDALAARDGCTRRHVETTIPLAFLAPDLVQAAIDAENVDPAHRRS